jgi:hypothetical protein
LSARRPRNQVISKENTKARCGFPSVGTTSPIGIGVGDEVKRGLFMELQAEVRGALDIAQDAFDELKVRVARGMHMKAYLLDGVGKIRTGESKVLKRAS